jgi:protein-disulfide isomerase
MSKQGREQNRTERAAAIRAQQQRSENLKKLGLIAGIVIVIGAIIAAGVIFGGGSGKDATPVDQAKLQPRAGDHSLLIGPADAATKVVIYEDFQCPYCREFEMSSRDFLHEYAAKGKVQVEYRPFNLLSSLPYSERALDAFIAVLEKGTPGQALELHDALYDHQPYEQSSDSVSVDDIKGWVEDTGAGEAAVSAIQDDHEAWFTAAMKAAKDAHVQGTPTVLVNGQPLQAPSVGAMATQLEQMIAKGK